MRYKKWILILVAIVVICVVLPEGTRKIKEYKRDHSGIPDAVSSFSMNNDDHLIVVANSNAITDKEEFARQVIRMCQENSFKSMKFSTDFGYSTSITIQAYLVRGDIGESEPVCEITYLPEDWNAGYDIKHNPDKFTLTVDGKEIRL